MEILTFGGGGRIARCEKILSAELSARSGRLILLPIPTSRDKKYISGTTIPLEDIIPLLDNGAHLVGYDLPPLLRLWADRLGCSVYDGALDEDFLTANAELTARGTLGHILTKSKKDISEMKIGVVGYGRIGMRLVRLLLQFGCPVTVYTGRSEVALELGENGVSAEILSDVCNFSSLDLLVNTAPARQIDEGNLPPTLPIIDLASGNYFTPSDRLTKLPSIPEALYPMTAGRLYAEGVFRYLKETTV